MTNIFSITSSVLPPSAHVVGFRGAEAISRPYRFDIGLIVPSAFEVDMEAAMGGRATLLIDRGLLKPPQHFSGVLASLELLHEMGDKSLYQATLVPKLWQLTLTQHSRIYTDGTIPEIIGAVLKDSGFTASDFSFRLSHAYKPLEHVCQYRESYFDFISRLMEREGMYYFFEHADDGETMVITDHASFHKQLHPEAVTFHPISGQDVSADEALNSFHCKVSSLPKKVHFNDYDYVKPGLKLSEPAPVVKNGFGEIVSYGENFQTPGDGQRLAKVRAEALLAKQTMFHARGRVFYLRSGYRFTFEDHPRPSFNTEYLATQIQHHGNQSNGSPEVKEMLGLEHDEEYRVFLEAIPADVQFRSERITAWPRVDGVVDAVVCGDASSPYAQIDSHGRYKIRVNFDESDLLDGKASTWVRMLQPHGGSTEGFHFPLRKGTEVHLVFLGGDPDRPVIVGVGPNTHKPSAVTASNHTMNVIQTGGANRLEMDDTGGAQYITMTSPTVSSYLHLGSGGYNYVAHTDGNGNVDIAGNYDILVGGDMTEDVGGSVTETYHSTQSTTVDAAVTQQYNATLDLTVTGAVTNTFEATLDTSVTGAVTNLFDATFSETVVGAVSKSYDATLDVNVTGAVTETYAATLAQTVTGAVTEVHQATRDTTVLGAVTDSFNATWDITVAGAVTGTMPTATWNCPDWSVNSGSFWERKGFSGTITGASIGITGAAVSVNGLSLTANGVSLNFTGLNLDLTIGRISNEPFWVKTIGPRAAACAVDIVVAAVIILL